MISLQKFLLCVEMNAARTRRYQPGGDGTDGDCDCIGLIIGAIRLAGGKWTGTHGSNYAARHEMRTLEKITSAKALFLGEVVYKIRNPGHEKYRLPDKYKSSGDLKDYYHVGTVTSLNPLNITHCTDVPGGIKIDTGLGQWSYGGQLKMVDYGGGDQMDVLYQATVTAVSGRTVHLRANPSEKAKVLKSVPVGAEVDVLEETDATWAKIFWNGLTGYMMRKFLQYVYPDDGEMDIHAELETLREQLVNALETVDKLLSGDVG